ncbi:hypothetical protein GCM10018793_30440 [Streptomyces sulfonofaciens]|uniref:Phage baseplate protein n=1 Tax=Streptomyces sulfonofaciens TaxID=68272 RepID=A0A919L144_9ACTN|nr:hypothetical protein [Streptomyces sulfonofaciens]GHH78866.1 hypothetical protein GCM10018793_30440 [Streptomyces sulfonofaciens]
MTVTGPAELLATWEAGLAARAAARARLLHRAARPEADDEALAALPVGAREADLLALRRALFGERMQVRLECTACGAAMEFELAADRFAERFGGDAAARGSGGPLRVSVDGWEVVFRPPRVADVTAAAGAAHGAASGDAARRALLLRCLDSVLRDGAPLDAETAVDLLPASVQRALAEAAERADPGADVTFGIGCPECGEVTRAELDIASYLWTELDAWARDLLLDVHLLASSYGWSEPEILALSPLRRRYYLELCADA